jgi:hypothetical protein
MFDHYLTFSNTKACEIYQAAIRAEGFDGFFNRYLRPDGVMALQDANFSINYPHISGYLQRLNHDEAKEQWFFGDPSVVEE